MFKWLKFHRHTYTNWKIVKVMKSDCGQVKLVQIRTCTECHFTQINTQEK